MKRKEIITKIADDGVEPTKAGYKGRIDKFLADLYEGWSRSMVDELISSGAVFLNDRVLSKGSKRLRGGDEIRIVKEKFDEVKGKLQKKLTLRNFGSQGGKNVITPEKMFLDIVYEDDDVLAINKPAGMVVHPAAGHFKSTLVNGVAWYLNQKGIKKPRRVGMIHRLDKDVRGLILFAKNDWALSALSRQFGGGSVDSTTPFDMSKKALKKYLALVIFSDKARRFLKYPRVEKDCWRRIEGYVRRDPNNRKKFEFSPRRPFLVGDKGRYSLSFIRIKKEFLGVDCDLIKDVDSSGQDQKYALAEVHIITGRTHQIRVHLSSIGMPIVGDSVYAGVDLGRTAKFQGVGLESYRISYIPSGVYGQLCENNNTEGSNSGLDRYPNQANEKSRKDCEWGRGRFAGFWDESTKRREISLPESIFADLL